VPSTAPHLLQRIEKKSSKKGWSPFGTFVFVVFILTTVGALPYTVATPTSTTTTTTATTTASTTTTKDNNTTFRRQSCAGQFGDTVPCVGLCGPRVCLNPVSTLLWLMCAPTSTSRRPHYTCAPAADYVSVLVQYVQWVWIQCCLLLYYWAQ
jgi:hypothetical protein